MNKILALVLLLTPVFVMAGPGDSLRHFKKDTTILFPSHVEAIDASVVYNDAHYNFIEGLVPSTSVQDSTEYYINQARAVIAKLRETKNFIEHFDASTHFQLPVGISKEIGGLKYDIAINAVRLKPAYAEIDVFMQFDPPQGQTLTFMARGIKLTQKGGIVGSATLELVGDYGINFNGNKGQLYLKGSQSKGKTYVTMDCDGFKEMGLDGEVRMSRDLMVPENQDGSIGAGTVNAAFTTVLSNWNDLVVQISMPSFQLTSLKDFTFDVQDAVFDFSDLRNAPAVVFPANYASTQMLPGNPNLWRGFYLRQLTVKLPKELMAKGATGRTTIQASNVLIDNVGFSGSLKAANLISLERGDMNGWAFSLDSLSVNITANQLTKAGFSGKIVVPVSDEKTPFNYGATISNGGNYLFNVSSAKQMSFNLWNAAQVDIYPASYLEVKVVDHKFLPKACLNGKMTVEGKLSEGGKGVSLADITFENLIIQAEKPYIKVGNFSFGSEALQQKMAGFPISIHDIGLKSISDTEVGLDFNIKLNLVGENSGGFAADAGLTLVGKMDSEKGWQSWRYKTILVREIDVNIDGGAYKIEGHLIFYRNDKTYGDGFNGVVKAEFTPGIKLSSTAIFGNVNGLRYWYADGMVNFPSAIPIFSGVGIYGFGGGVYFAMKMDNTGAGSDLGKTASGAIYVPDTKAGLGLKAIVSLGSMPSGAFDAEVTFEIAFFQGGGVRYISFGGNGSVATKGVNLPMDKLKGSVGKMVSAVKDKVGGSVAANLLDSGGDNNSLDKIFGDVQDKANQDGSISARMLMSYDFENHVLHGNFEVYVNVAGGIIQGVGPGGRAGWSVLHFTPHEWYIYAGTPDDRVGVKIGIGSISLSATSYFMVGTKILDSPPPPPEVSKILGGIDLDYMKDLNALGDGAGFAFGAALSMNTGDLTFLMFYSSFQAGLGFDIMLKNYGNTMCKGSDKRIGINGWYANGQSYAYFEGAIGIRVKVFGKKKKVQILEIAAATVMQAKLPNPVWMRGIVGGHFSVLGGLVKGHCKFEVTLGHDCEIARPVEDMLGDIKVIANLTPAADENNVNVFTTPQAVFNMAVGKDFELVDEVDVRHHFRIKLNQLKLTANGKEIPCSIDWNDELEVAALNSFDILPPQSNVTISCLISFEENKNGTWQGVSDNGQPVTEKMEQNFKTGTAPDYIPLSNVDYSYPYPNQLNFYRDQARDGYIKLKKGQPYLFDADPQWKQVGRFTSDAKEMSEFDFAYSSATATVSFKMPATLKLGINFAFDLMKVPTQKSGAIDRNVKQNSQLVNGDSSAVVSTKTAEGSIADLQEKSIFSTAIRTSKYATLDAKIDAAKARATFRLQRPIGDYLNTYLALDEPFDKAELEGNEYTQAKPMINLVASLKGNAYYQNQVYPLVYANYPLAGTIRVSRDTSVLGMPPVRAVSIEQTPNDFELVNGQVAPSALSTDDINYTYDLPHYMALDFREIQQGVVSRYAYDANRSSQVQNIITAPVLPTIKEGDYNVMLIYSSPGSPKPLLVKPITIKFHY